VSAIGAEILRDGPHAKALAQYQGCFILHISFAMKKSFKIKGWVLVHKS
jgi:hypothetical protein